MKVLAWLLLPLAVAALNLSPRNQIPLAPWDHTQGYQFDELLHLPGISPYFDAVGFGLEHRAPTGCNVTAASYLIRHAAIYANDDEYEEYIKPFLWKLEKHREGWTGPLEFMLKWHSPILEDKLEDITPSGAEDAVKVGKHLVSRYPELALTVQRILADKKSRTFDTAKALVRAFPHTEEIEVVQVLKNVNGSMDVLVPHKTCPNFNKKPGASEMATFVAHYAPLVARRLQPFVPEELDLVDNDIVALQQLCGYESAINGKRSDICAVFTDAEWMAYEYAMDLKYAHMVGPLNPLSPYLGFPWLKAQTELFSQLDDASSPDEHAGWPASQRFFLAFTHREVPPFVATALGLFNSSSNATEEFPTDRINWTRAWRMSDLIPFLGHVGLEKMSCGNRGPGMEGEFVRVIANTAPRPIPECQAGPGASCGFEEFQKLVQRGVEVYGDFDGACGKRKK